jgi:hypothetical protein
VVAQVPVERVVADSIMLAELLARLLRETEGPRNVRRGVSLQGGKDDFAGCHIGWIGLSWMNHES